MLIFAPKHLYNSKLKIWLVLQDPQLWHPIVGLLLSNKRSTIVHYDSIVKQEQWQLNEFLGLWPSATDNTMK